MLEFGKIIKYLDNGFGFIKALNPESSINGKEIFFHIKAVKKFEDDLINFNEGTLENLYFWFIYKEGKKGKEVVKFWGDAQDIPSEHTIFILNEYSTNLINKENESPFKRKFVAPSLPIKLQDNIDELCKKYNNNPNNIRNDSKMRHVCLNCGEDNSEFKKSERDFYKLVSSFVPTRYIKSAEGYHRCCKCQTTWYVNYCWSCHSGRVDDRDPKTPHCKECTWCKCDKCSACSYYGCKTNSYSKDHKYVDEAKNDTYKILF
ncbi:MAG: hypothetical protein QS721_12950 [Candidatus Endonucleobacter sp. (ex Gigantidas childressi)]|nr:hypothetical protein [Candidatus Endonucleobacter sp. (ex Gigantidas childressi)]